MHLTQRVQVGRRLLANLVEGTFQLRRRGHGAVALGADRAKLAGFDRRRVRGQRLLRYVTRLDRVFDRHVRRVHEPRVVILQPLGLQRVAFAFGGHLRASRGEFTREIRLPVRRRG